VARGVVLSAADATMLKTCAHLWPDSDESTRAAVASVLAGRVGSSRTTGTASDWTCGSKTWAAQMS